MRALALFAGFAAISSGAFAQQVVEGQDVSDRPHAEYDQLGLHVHDFVLLPSVTGTLAATDNYRATPNDRRANVALLLRPDLTWRSNWGRHRVDGDMFFEQRVNTPLHRENGNSYGITSHGVYEFSRDSYFRIGGVAQRLTESRGNLGSLQEAIEPVRFDLLRGDATLSKTFVLLKLEATGAVESRNYYDALLPGGAKLSQDYRDVLLTTVGGTADYDLENGITVLVTGQYSNYDYRLGPGRDGFIPGVTIDRDSSGGTLRAGVNLELSQLVFGTLQVGYLRRDYKDPRLHDVSGVSFEGSLSWNVTPLTTLVASGRRWVEESASVFSEGNVRNDIKLGVHHELYRYVLLTGELSYSRFKPVGIGSSGSEYAAVLGGRYLISRRLTLNGQVRYVQRTSNSLYLPYHATEARISLRYGI